MSSSSQCRYVMVENPFSHGLSFHLSLFLHQEHYQNQGVHLSHGLMNHNPLDEKFEGPHLPTVYPLEKSTRKSPEQLQNGYMKCKWYENCWTRKTLTIMLDIDELRNFGMVLLCVYTMVCAQYQLA